MNIVHCLLQYLPDYVAGTEVYTHALALLQQEKGHNVAVLTPHIEYHRPGKIKPHYVYDGIDVYQFNEPSNPTDRRYFSGKKKPEGLSNFVTVLQSLKPDVIHFHELNRSTGITVEHVKQAKQLCSKVFITMHLSFYTCNTNQLIRNKNLCSGKIDTLACTACSYNSLFGITSVVARPLAWLSVMAAGAGLSGKVRGKAGTLVSMPSAIQRIQNELQTLSENVNAIVSLTHWYKKMLVLNGVPEYKIETIPQALAIKPAAGTIKKRTVADQPLKIAFVGRIQPQKGIHLMIEALLSFKDTEIESGIFGAEENTEYYRSCVASTRNFGAIKWKGQLQRNEVLSNIGDYDILCLPSLFSEMSPLVIQEAFSAGLPVLASRVYGNMEQIEDGYNGLLFDFDSAADLQAKLRSLVTNRSLVEELKKNVLAPETFDKVCNRYLDLYEQQVTD